MDSELPDYSKPKSLLDLDAMAPYLKTSRIWAAEVVPSPNNLNVPNFKGFILQLMEVEPMAHAPVGYLFTLAELHFTRKKCDNCDSCDSCETPPLRPSGKPRHLVTDLYYDVVEASTRAKREKESKTREIVSQYGQIAEKGIREFLSHG